MYPFISKRATYFLFFYSGDLSNRLLWIRHTQVIHIGQLLFEYLLYTFNIFKLLEAASTASAIIKIAVSLEKGVGSGY